MNARVVAERFVEILEKHYLWCFEDVNDCINRAGNNDMLEFTLKASGDSYESTVESEFNKYELDALRELAKQLKYRIPDTIWHD